MVGIQTIGEGTATASVAREWTFPDPEHPGIESGWKKSYVLTAVPADGWVFSHWEFESETTVQRGDDPPLTDTSSGSWSENPQGSSDWYSEPSELDVVYVPGGAASIKSREQHYTSIKAVFVSATATATLTVVPSEASVEGCSASLGNGGVVETKHAASGERVRFDFSAERADGWRFYGWRVSGQEAIFSRQREESFEVAAQTGGYDLELEAVFRRADGLPLCKASPSNARKFFIVCDSTSGEIFCND